MKAKEPQFKNGSHYLPAFTLTEMLTVLIIIGILVGLAVPIYNSIILRGRQQEAKLQLSHLHQLQKSHQLEHTSYASQMEAVNYEQARLTTQDGNANYLLSVVKANNREYIAKATSVVDWDGDGVYDTWQIDQNGKLENVISD